MLHQAWAVLEGCSRCSPSPSQSLSTRSTTEPGPLNSTADFGKLLGGLLDEAHLFTLTLALAQALPRGRFETVQGIIELTRRDESEAFSDMM